MSEIWIDSSIPKDVAYALARVRKDISWVGDLYQFQRNKYPIWLPDAGKQNALVILRDKKVTTRPGERAAIMDNKVGAFVLTQKRNPNKWEYLRLIVGCLDQMERVFKDLKRPFIWTVDSHGVLHPYDPRPPVLSRT